MAYPPLLQTHTTKIERSGLSAFLKISKLGLVTAFLFLLSSSAVSQSYTATSVELPTALDAVLDSRITGAYQIYSLPIDSIISYVRTEEDSFDIEFAFDSDTFDLKLTKRDAGSSIILDTTATGAFTGKLVNDSINSSLIYLSEPVIYMTINSDSGSYNVVPLRDYGEEFDSYSDHFVTYELPTDTVTSVSSEECEPYYIQLGVFCDREFLERYDNDEETAIHRMQLLITLSEEFYSRFFDLYFIVDGPYAFNQTFSGAFNTLSSNFNGWTTPACEKVEIVVYFTGRLIAGGGQSNGKFGATFGKQGFCMVEVRATVPEQLHGAQPRYLEDLFHEIGHNLIEDLGHIDNPESSCAESCEETQTPLMCSFPNPTTPPMLSSCTKTAVLETLEANCDILKPPSDDPCETCGEIAELSIEESDPFLVGCNNTAEFTIHGEFHNDCDEEDILMEFWYVDDHVELLDYDEDVFELKTIVVGGDTWYLVSMKEEQTVGELESFSAEIKAKLIDVSSSNITSLRLYVREEYLENMPHADQLEVRQDPFMSVGTVDVSTINTEGKNLLIDGTLTIDVDLDYEDGIIFLKDDSKIVVDEDIKFSIKDAELRACTNEWDHIYMSPGSELVVEGSLISGADKAVNIDNSSVVTIGSTTFKDNHASVYSAEGEKLVYLNIGDGTIFQDGFVGLQLADVRGFNVGSAGDPVLFEDLNVGAILRDCNGVLSNSMFHRISNTTSNPSSIMGSGVVLLSDGNSMLVVDGGLQRNVVFTDMETAIYSRNAALRISRAAVTDCEEGIRIGPGFSNHIYVNDCYLDVEDFGIRVHSFGVGGVIKNNGVVVTKTFGEAISLSNAWGDLTVRKNRLYAFGSDAKGVVVQNSEGFNVKYNEIYLTDVDSEDVLGCQILRSTESQIGCNQLFSNSSTNGAIGIEVQASSNVGYNCNQMEDFEIATRFLGMCNGSGVLGQSFSSSANGLLLGSGILGSDAVTGPQQLQGNLWVGPFSQLPAWNYSPGALHASSLFTINNSEQYNAPQNIASLSGWFVNSAGSVYTCNVTSSCLLPVDIGNNLVEIPSDTFEVFDDAKKYLWQHQVYASIFDGTTDTTSNAYLDSLFQSHSSTSLGTLSRIERKYKTAYKSVVLDTSRYAPFLDETLAELDTIAPLYREMFTADSARAGVVYSQIDSILSLLDTLNTEISGWLDTSWTELVTDIQSLDDTNSNVTALDTFDYYEKVVNGLLLEQLAVDSIDFAPQDSSDLRAIAGRCPFSDGPGVYSARALLPLLGVIVRYNDSALCDTSGQVIVSTEDLKSELPVMQLIPNPARPNSQLRIQIMDDNRAFSLTHARIISTDGRRASQAFKLIDGTLDLEGLPPGYYLVAGYSGDSLIGVGKLIIMASD